MDHLGTKYIFYLPPFVIGSVAPDAHGQLPLWRLRLFSLSAVPLAQGAWSDCAGDGTESLMIMMEVSYL